MAKTNGILPTATHLVVVVVLGLSVIFNLVTFRMLLEESRVRTYNDEGLRESSLQNADDVVRLKACIDEGTRPCDVD